MKHFFNNLGIKEHDKILYEMGIKEKEHEVYFLSKIKNNKLLPFFEKVFKWGNKKSANNININELEPVESSDQYCRK